jgi:hypothetical protein
MDPLAPAEALMVYEVELPPACVTVKTLPAMVEATVLAMVLALLDTE